MNNLYIYFSGTGNTKYIINSFAKLYEETDQLNNIYSIENKSVNFGCLIEQAKIIIIAYPIYGSILPPIMDGFLNKHLEAFKNKTIISICTQAMFSGDGGSLVYYKLKKMKVKLLHSIHVNMPANITDIPIFKIQKEIETENTFKKADFFLEKQVEKIKQGKTIKMGRGFISWAMGFFFQRLWFKLIEKKYRSKIRIDSNICVNCNLCKNICPTDNLYEEDNIIKSKDVCTFCYRCINQCPKQAISLLSNRKPKKQYIRKDYN